MLQEYVLTNDKLKELFPQYEQEIVQASKEMACGCSYCVWHRLKFEHPEIELPATDMGYLCV